MEIKKGVINFNSFSIFNTGISNMNEDDYILINELETNKLNDNYVNKYVKSIQILCVSSGTGTVTIKFEDSTPDRIFTLSLSSIVSYLSSYDFPNGIQQVIGKIETNSLDTNIITPLKNYVDDSINCIFYYRIKSPKITLNKSLEFVKCEYVKYTRPITHRNVTLDVKQSASDEQYNYVYLTVLNRYYFVADAVLQNDMFVLTLREDVLMSFKDLIKKQTAFIERNENNYNDDIVDDFLSYDYEKKITKQIITPTNDIYIHSDIQEHSRSSFILTVISGI